ncbi:hypothetical protein QOZ80_1AG0024550 [Eleusine coracana subsp. coracana]|nr:hypothetical protein QOZ80_1AG0024550 [Eleusine coracana subsp. coracana]
MEVKHSIGERRVEMSLLPLKKRALNDNGCDRCGNSDESRSLPPKMRRIDDCIGAERKVDAEGGEAPFPRHPGSSAAEGDATSDAEKLRLSKGKWKATAETNSVDEPPVKKRKLMHDGIRSGARFNERFLDHHVHAPRDAYTHGATEVVTNAAKTKKQQSTEEAVLGGEARARLAELGATRPWFVYRKRLEKSDVCPNQNRLLISCKRDSLAGCPVTRCFSPAEMRRVENKHAGLFVATLDRDGVGFLLTCKFLDSNSGYRFINDWKKLLKRNGLVLDGRGRWTRDVDIELWAFRSRALPRQPLLGPDGKLPAKGKDGKPVPGKVVDEHFHPDGSLGLLLLHRENRMRRVDSEEDDDGDEPPLPVARRPQKKQQGIKQRDKRKQQGEAAAAVTMMSKVEMVAKFGVFTSDAVIGMMGLRDAMLRERQQQNVEVGCAT